MVTSTNRYFLPLNHLAKPRKKLAVKVKTTDGAIYRGDMYLREQFYRFKEELNTNEEAFVALTGVSDPNNQLIPYTFLINYNHIVYIALKADVNDQRFITLEERGGGYSKDAKRKVKAILRLSDKTGLTGIIFVRNTFSRAKDELNLKEGKFMTVIDVQEQGPNRDDDHMIYYINKEYIIFVAVAEDRKEDL